ncbi:MAG: glycosyltransferase [Chitinophagales bacterium]|nr:glycosyltransferase [Chitinophagales bacterium]
MLHILTLTYKAENRIGDLYNSLTKSKIDCNFIWHIKDNKSVDSTKEIIKSWNDSRVNLFECPHNNDSFAYGMNVLFKRSEAKDEDYILLLNDDVIFNDPSDIQKMINCFSNKSVGAVGCKLLYKNTDKIQHAGVIFDNIKKLPLHFGANCTDNNFFSQTREFQAVTGAVLLTKAEYYKNIKNKNKSGHLGMDEDFQWAFEDVSACLSIKYDLNKKIICLGNVNIFHEESATLKKNPLNWLNMKQNVANFYSKWGNRCKCDREDYEKLLNGKMR